MTSIWAAFALLVLACVVAADMDQWDCTLILSKELAPGALWEQKNCTSTTGSAPIGPVKFNIVTVDLTAKNLNLVGVAANATVQLATVPDMAPTVPGALVGINGGYFFEINKRSFFDNVCFGKTRQDALQPPSAGPNCGLGDSLLIIDGVTVANNCDLPGYAVPTALVLNGTGSYITKLPKGGKLPAGVPNAIGAGPNLLTYDAAHNAAVVDIPLNSTVNVFEHAANTAVGLTFAKSSGSEQQLYASTLTMLTVDGHDGGSMKDPLSGLNAEEMAHFMRFLGVHQAMGMDQGGSTTMWVRGAGLVSCADTTQPTAPPRPVFDALFLVGV